MNFYFAPMEGLTGYIYRNAHHELFNGIRKYYSPFIVANQNDNFKSREMKDISPENNKGLTLIPQLLTNNAKDFIYTSRIIKELGYQEINLNLGCPSGTVVAKKRGSGFLAMREALDRFLEEIFAESLTKISIKTRIGKDEPEEFYDLIEIFNKYPIEELIIHPRIQKDYYKNKPNLTVFKDALHLSKNPLCYNGDIFTIKDYHEFTRLFPEVQKIMLGRGLITNPGLIHMITDQKMLDKNLLKDFHDRVLEGYKQTLYGDRNILFKMKEIWAYMIVLFSDHTKYAKKIRKSEHLTDYEAIVNSLFREQELNEGYSIISE